MSKKRVKRKAGANAKAAEGSKIIELSVAYVQHLAAYEAGFKVDHTGDSQYASKGRQISKARCVLTKLMGRSPHCKGGDSSLTAVELQAKAGVLAAMYGLNNHGQIHSIELAYIGFFAGEVSDFLAANHPATP